MQRFVFGAIQAVIAIVLVGGLLFGTAGRLDVPQFWLYVSIFAASCIAGALVVDPTLYSERLRPGGRPIDPRYWGLVALVGIHWCVAGLDVGRFHWSAPLPPFVWIVGNAFVAGAVGVMLWAMHVNRFFSSVVRIQTERGHVLVTDGPYRYVRHPGYAAGVVLSLASGIALGSLWSIVPAVVGLPLLYARIVREDRILREQLPGYAEYAARVRWRLAPGIW